MRTIKTFIIKLCWSLAVGLFFWLVSSGQTFVQADITNPAVGELGGCTQGVDGCVEDPASIGAAKSGATFLIQIVGLWRNVINLGAIMVLLYFILGAVEWITSGGDKNKLENARNKMLHAILGLVILVSSFVVIGFVSGGLFAENFDILNLQFFTPGDAIE